MTWQYVIIAVFAKLSYKQQGSFLPAQHSPAQHSTAQHSTAQHSTAQHSTAQHSTLLCPAGQLDQGILLLSAASISAQNQTHYEAIETCNI